MNTPTPLQTLGAAACWLALAALSPAAQAADRCAGSADETALLRCRQADAKAAQRAVQQAVDRLRQRYAGDEPERLKLLLAAQQAWARFQQAECRFQTQESAGGAAHAVYLLDCQTRQAAERLKALQTILANP